MFLIVNLRGAHLWILSFEAWNSNTRGLHQSPGIFNLWWSQCLFVLFQSRKLHGTGTASASWSVWLFLSSPSHPVHCVSSPSLTRNRTKGAGGSAKLGLRPVALGVFFFFQPRPFRSVPDDSLARSSSPFVRSSERFHIRRTTSAGSLLHRFRQALLRASTFSAHLLRPSLRLVGRPSAQHRVCEPGGWIGGRRTSFLHAGTVSARELSKRHRRSARSAMRAKRSTSDRG